MKQLDLNNIQHCLVTGEDNRGKNLHNERAYVIECQCTNYLVAFILVMTLDGKLSTYNVNDIVFTNKDWNHYTVNTATCMSEPELGF